MPASRPAPEAGREDSASARAAPGPPSSPISGVASDVARALAAAGVAFRVHGHAPVRNVHEALAAGLPFDPALLTKTLVYRLPERWALAWVRALDRVDYPAFARAVRANRRQVRFADDDEVVSVFAWEPGGAAPLASAPGSELYVDSAVVAMPRAYCGGGRRDLTLEIEPAEWLARVPHRVATFARSPDAGSTG